MDTYEFPDGRLEIRARGVSLPYRMFDKEQRVTHAAITENKRLTEVLAFIQTQQDQDPPKARRAGKQRTRYEPTGRKPGGNNTLRDRRWKAAEVAQATSMPAE